MTGTGILDTDMTTLLRQLRAGWDWWLQELAAMVPPWWRSRSARRPGLVAHFDGTAVTLTRRDVPVTVRAGGVAAVVALPAERCLVRELWLPAMSPRDLRRLIALDTDRLMPFPPGTALFDSEVVARDPAAGRQLVAVAALPRAVAEAAITSAADAGIEPRGLGIARPGGLTRFDFLPALAADGLGAAGVRARRFWWSVVAGLLALNLIVLVASDINATRQLETLVDEHGDTALLARKLRLRVIGEEMRRAALLDRRSNGDPLVLIADVTRLLPDGAWVQRFVWDGRQLRLTGFQHGGIDVVAALRRSPRFQSARPTGSDVPAPTRSGQPFDVTIDVATRHR